MARTKLEVGKNDLATNHPGLCREWDVEKNGPLAPSDVTCHSGKKVWWKCGKGHSWQATISNRVSLGNGCPYCSGYLAIKGETDLETLYKDICLEWDYSRNIGLSPSDFTANSGAKVWWVDTKGNHWMAKIFQRVGGTGSPYHTGRSMSRTRLI